MKSEIYIKMRQRLHQHHAGEGILFVVTGLLGAVVCSIYARVFKFAELQSLSFFSQHTALTLLVFPICMAGAYILVRWFAPGASGSGIPQVLASIESRQENFIRPFLKKSVILVKIGSSFLAVIGGAAIGREGPSIQIAAAVAYNTGKFFERFFGIKVKVEQLLVAGAAGGLAAAFNTPIGGVVYAIEELSKEHVRTFKDVLLLSVVIAGLTAQLINGNYLFLGYPAVPGALGSWGIFLVTLCAFLTGISGSISAKLLIRLIHWRRSRSFPFQLGIVIGLGVLFAAVFIWLGPRHLYSGKETIQAILFPGEIVPWYEAVTRTIMPVLSSMSGIAGGIFAPALSAGAAIGGVFAGLIDPDFTVILGLAGMVGFLTGITHTPITSFILVLEMTDRHAVVFPLMIAALCASLATHLISERSFYEEMAEGLKSQ